MKSSNYGNGLAGALAGVLVDVIVSAIDVATTEHIEAARHTAIRAAVPRLREPPSAYAIRKGHCKVGEPNVAL